jgi:hypothetical protein
MVAAIKEEVKEDTSTSPARRLPDPSFPPINLWSGDKPARSNLLSIQQVRAYALVNGKRIRLVDTTFNQCPDADDVASMQPNPLKFMGDLSYVPAPPPAPRPPLAMVDTSPSETEPSVA